MVKGPSLAVVSNPSLAVLRGAVLFGLNQKTIASRVMQHTFGIETSEAWTPEFEEVIICWIQYQVVTHFLLTRAIGRTTEGGNTSKWSYTSDGN
jgi:hypothetical protein